jgi:phosphoserine phosphatase
MEIAITFVAAAGSGALLSELAESSRRAFGGEGKRSWLAEGEAMDLILPAKETPAPQSSPHGAREFARPVSQGEREQQRPLSPRGERQSEEGLSKLKEVVAELVASRPVDWCVQPAASRRKRMLIADMDSTIIGQECLDEMAALKGVKPEVAGLTERAMRGELDFEAALRERIRLLGGLTEADLQCVLDERITLNPGARTLVETMKAHGAHTVLVSGGFTFFTKAVAARTGFARNRANLFLWRNGRLVGVAEPILGREAKLATLKEEAAAHGFSPDEAVAVGDGANDLAMLRAAGLGVAYRAKPVVAAEADAQVNHTDLTALLYFQGYNRGSFAH